MKKNIPVYPSQGKFVRVTPRMSCLLVILVILTIWMNPVDASGKLPRSRKYAFDGSISREVLENYLDRSVTMGYFLVNGKPEGYEFPYREDDIRMIKSIGVKFIGRAIYRWGQESWLNDPGFLGYAKNLIERVHAIDPDIIFQGCLFESVSRDVEKVKIPDWVFKEFGLPAEDRSFRSDSITKRPNQTAASMGRGRIPVINNLETRVFPVPGAPARIMPRLLGTP